MIPQDRLVRVGRRQNKVIAVTKPAALQLVLMMLMYAARMKVRAALLLFFVVAGCNGEIYLRDGVTDGDTFYLALNAHFSDDPVLQSWVSYSLTRSTCQLEIGGDNPARESSYDCEYTARNHLLNAWERHIAVDPGIHDEYLDTLLTVREAGYIEEYIAEYFGRRHWQIPVESDVDGFRRWRREHLRRHKAETRIIGWWSYSKGTSDYVIE